MIAAAALLLMALNTHAQPFEEALRQVRAERPDLAVRLDRWETPFPLSSVDWLLGEPLAVPQIMDAWASELSASGSTRTASSFAAELLGKTTPIAPKPVAEVQLPASELPAPLEAPIRYLAAIVQAAQERLAAASPALRPDERRLLLETVREMIIDEEVLPPRKSVLELAARFNVGAMLEAADLLEAAASAVPRLREAAGALAPGARVRIPMPFGDILVSGTGDDLYTAKDLGKVSLLVDLGGRSRYEWAPGASFADGVNLAIDLSADVEVSGHNAVVGRGAASGVFGVGALFLPNPAGTKTLAGGDVSLGAGLFGAGILHASGKVILKGGRFSQGAGAFGLGACLIEGDGARLTLRQSGQGFGFTQGVGLLRLRGKGAVMEGGLVEPDPRDPKGALSLSQGAGYGPRAWAAGGVGLALIAGDDNSLTASYMAQGMGYWRGFGGLFVVGNGNRIQGRRYVQGAGVHTAPGGFLIRGSRNKTVSWGVGPAMGWDWGVGVLDSQGDENSFSSEWASGRGDVNGHGLAHIRGKKNSVALGGFGSGALKRGAGSYGLGIVEGEEPLALGWDSYGAALQSSTATLKPEIPNWPEVPRQNEWARDRERLVARLKGSNELPGQDGATRALWAISSAGLDFGGALAAAKDILLWEKKRAELLPTLLAPENFNGMVWLRVLIPAHGRELKDALLKELAAAKDLRRAMLLGQLGRLPLKDALDEALEALKDPDWRVRQTAIGVLGRYLDKGKGQEPGRRRLLEASERACASKTGLQPNSEEETRWLADIGEQYLPDLYSVLNLTDLEPSDRAALLGTQDPFAPAQPPLLREFARLLKKDGACPELLRAELSAASKSEDKILKAVRPRLEDKEPEVIQAAALALGGAARPEDAARLIPLLEEGSALLREGGAAALSRMGPAGLPALQAALRAPSARTRAHAAAALARTGDAECFPALKEAFADADPLVRRTAAAGLLAVQNPLVNERKQFIEELLKLESSDPDPSVRAQAARARAAITP